MCSWLGGSLIYIITALYFIYLERLVIQFFKQQSQTSDVSMFSNTTAGWHHCSNIAKVASQVQLQNKQPAAVYRPSARENTSFSEWITEALEPPNFRNDGNV